MSSAHGRYKRSTRLIYVVDAHLTMPKEPARHIHRKGEIERDRERER